MFIMNNYDKIKNETNATKDGIKYKHCKIDERFKKELSKYIERKNIEKEVIKFRENYDKLLNEAENEKIRSKKEILKINLEEFIKNNPNVSKYADKRSYNSFISEIESFETKYNNINNVCNLNDDSYVIFYSLIDSLNERIFIRTYLELLRNENIKLKTQGQKYNEEIMKKHEEEVQKIKEEEAQKKKRRSTTESSCR